MAVAEQTHVLQIPIVSGSCQVNLLGQDYAVAKGDYIQITYRLKIKWSRWRGIKEIIIDSQLDYSNV